MSIKSDTAKAYLKKYPDTPSLTLAKLLFKNHPKMFTTVDDARTKIRYLRGQSGERCRKHLSTPEFIKPAGEFNPFDSLPEPIESLREWKPYELYGDRILCLFDVHVPYYDKQALILAIKYGIERNADTIFLGGDFWDFYNCSFWDKDPDARSMKQELLDGIKILKFLRDSFPKARIIYKVGNHEERLERYLRIKAPEIIEGYENEPDDESDPLTNISIVKSFRKIIKAPQLGINTVENKRIVKFGRHLNIIHGHEVRGCQSSVNPARTLYMNTKEIAACGHHHRTSNHTEKTVSGKHISCWSVGCLCNLQPEYCPINNWNSGFAMIYKDGDGFEFENKRIINEKIY